MPARGAPDPHTFTTFGALLRYLRHRVQLTQRDLGIAVGYSEGHINRFEHNKHWPDPTAVAALFVPALDLGDEPELAARLIELATQARRTTPAATADQRDLSALLEPIPPAAHQAIARTTALARLRTRLAAERRVIVCGLPGTGKTTLVSDLAREYAERMPVLWHTFTAGVTTTPEAIISRLAMFLAAHGQELVKPLLAIEPQARGALTPDRQVALIGSALAHQPALLCFDNAELIHDHEDCLHILQHLSATTPAYLVLTSRESLPLPNLTEISLGGLNAAEGRALIAANIDRGLDEHQMARLVEKTAGNPMLLRLAIGKLLDDQTDVEPFIAHLETQPQVAAYLLQTIQRQSSPGAWRLLLLLAAFQQPIDLYHPHLIDLATGLGDIPHMGAAVTELQRRRLIDDAAYARLHPLVRDFVYRTLEAEATVRQRLHRLAAEWFRAMPQDTVTAAWHYSRAGLLQQAVEAIEENERVLTVHGEALTAVSILDEVHAQLKRARTDQTDLRRRLLTMRGILLRGTLRVTEGEANLREAVQLTNTPAVRASIISELAFLVLQRSEFREALQLAALAKVNLSPSDRLLRAQLASLEAAARGSLGQGEAAAQAAHEAVALLDQLSDLPQTMTGEIRARALGELSNEARSRRDLAAAMHYAQLAVTAARASGARRVTYLQLAYIGGLYSDLGDLDAAFHNRQAALEGLSAIGDVHSAAYMLTYLADIHHMRLEIDAALEKLDQADETLRIVGDMRGLAAAGGARTAALLWQGRVREARHTIEQVLQETKGQATERMWGYRLNKLAMVQLVQGEVDAALATLQEAFDWPATRNNHMLRFVLAGTAALACSVQGRQSAAMRHLADAPRIPGLSQWSESERALAEGYVALAGGDHATARALVDRIRPQIESYPLYRQTARQLLAALDAPPPVSQFPSRLWVQS